MDEFGIVAKVRRRGICFCRSEDISSQEQFKVLLFPLLYERPRQEDKSLEILQDASLHPVCPSCANVLTVSATTSPDDSTPTNRLECQTCPYEYVLTKRYYERKTFARKEREDVFGGPGAWDNAQKANMQCPKEGCDGEEAAFFQVQIRSADEPMTGFYKVCEGL
ncbi:DNA-directed RNA polymerase III subunit RPC10 [Hyphodiscus hymeniophilus]|uniref:DNA-directed RNA polymerase III subunit RPC10 n=1 Tax=Hyphodiscus hymeniophilus TaxID=353542 RepID=A0A9P7AZ58_9HELO|nr:DNA-directed RNA polymerase III subunit RPC10 [Hyphodiscus hymeniophilus]